LASPFAQAQPTDFDSWLAAFRQDAAAQGISAATLDSALTGVIPDERVIELDRRQPEFLQTFLTYLERRTTPRQIERGQALLVTHAALLDEIEQKYGIPKAVLVAFWGLETNYGAYLGGFNIPASLATLAFDGRRSAFFHKELLEALRIIDAGHVDAIDMNGSWAGAMGQMQFMPSTFGPTPSTATATAASTCGTRCPTPCTRRRIICNAPAGAQANRSRWKCGCPKASTCVVPG
jgi:membrane-bound lytic murein transglycosylase B